ncbi:helix-turn-helix transcriptional regulator [Rhizobium paknamense]|uniref:Transcriptional regulator with XRE-family HTH domain n=1 Tax=Rhizobium paknamense TaxID=1206817 RepID=A0ABU0IIW5_9HYPH|nr:helix-turn-helix transcriptional regulator [Rhizobium paknamense]MDQ0457176.1 transcriptional regulator with XRE-family HTH domain [Rhizobium paknamense]
MLGEFVRAHREKLTPEQPGGRRRTPGLRREELAERAGISSTWCAWIEQGRQVQASPQALARLANALELTRAERAYLFELADRRDPEDSDDGPLEDAPASLIAAVSSVPHPAYALDRYWNACSWNSAAAALFPHWLGEEGTERNAIRFVFTHPIARQNLIDWQARTRSMLAEFRADFSHSLRDPVFKELVETLRQESPLFDTAWQEHSVMERGGGERSFRHPERGILNFRQFNYRPTDRPDCKLVLLFPL